MERSSSRREKREVEEKEKNEKKAVRAYLTLTACQSHRVCTGLYEEEVEGRGRGGGGGGGGGGEEEEKKRRRRRRRRRRKKKKKKKKKQVIGFQRPVHRVGQNDEMRKEEKQDEEEIGEK